MTHPRDVVKAYAVFRKVLKLPYNKNTSLIFKRQYLGLDERHWILRTSSYLFYDCPDILHKLDILLGPHAHALVTAWWITKDEH